SRLRHWDRSVATASRVAGCVAAPSFGHRLDESRNSVATKRLKRAASVSDATALRGRRRPLRGRHLGLPPSEGAVAYRELRNARPSRRTERSRPSTAGQEEIMRDDIAPGGTFPDYELPDHERVPRKLSEIQGDDLMIVTLARGHYCPKEHQQHLELAANYAKINVAYTKVVTISTDTHYSSLDFRNSVGAQWPFLEDPGRIVQRDLDIQEYTDPENDPMIPHTLVLKPGLIIYSVYNGY